MKLIVLQQQNNSITALRKYQKIMFLPLNRFLVNAFFDYPSPCKY